MNNYKFIEHMKKYLIYSLLFFWSYSINAQEVNQIGTEYPLDCIELSEVKNSNNPADILIGTAKCIEQKQFDKAARLFMIAGAYGNYDISRVEDITAHNALSLLEQNLMSTLVEETKENLFSSLKKELKIDSFELNNNCQIIKEIGIPQYNPKYMIQYGVQVFSENEGNGLVENFNSDESWNTVLKSYLKCGEKKSDRIIGLKD